MGYQSKYSQLSRGKQRMLREQFIFLFACSRRSFYYKIREAVIIRPIEKQFFDNHLNPQT